VRTDAHANDDRSQAHFCRYDELGTLRFAILRIRMPTILSDF